MEVKHKKLRKRKERVAVVLSGDELKEAIATSIGVLNTKSLTIIGPFLQKNACTLRGSSREVHHSTDRDDELRRRRSVGLLGEPGDLHRLCSNTEGVPPEALINGESIANRLRLEPQEKDLTENVLHSGDEFNR
ncbi:hypothetical protein PROFUN_05671 [Planoprotostelium fungivorum]|uniref:Uncharacterized protein n=1 Tax=Planoprotostelium fungivorum TaxID=1890364 RepID=A0A2P6MUH8_9EUKA|nr:hypothetical protein PROFUN_05671 [Planoprotostelium fungivorum]